MAHTGYFTTPVRGQYLLSHATDGVIGYFASQAEAEQYAAERARETAHLEAWFDAQSKPVNVQRMFRKSAR